MKELSDYFPHDSNAMSDQKILMLRVKFGIEGYGLWWMVLETMAQDDNGYINRGALGGLCLPYNVSLEKLQGLIDYCVEIGLLNICEHGNYYNDRMVEHKEYLKNCVKWGKLGAEKKKNTTPLKAPFSPPPASKGKEIKLKENKVKEKEEEIEKSFKQTPSLNNSPDLRKKEFYVSIIVFKVKYSESMLEDFYRYWSELNQKKGKMKFELQDTWETGLRLSTWFKKSKEFKQGGLCGPRKAEFESDLSKYDNL